MSRCLRCCKIRKGKNKDKAEDFHHSSFELLLLAASELELSGYCEEGPFKPNARDFRGGKRLGGHLTLDSVKEVFPCRLAPVPVSSHASQRGISLHQSSRVSVL